MIVMSKWSIFLFLICFTWIELGSTQTDVNVDLKNIIDNPINADKLLDFICPDKLAASGIKYNGKQFYIVSTVGPEHDKAKSLQKATIVYLKNYIEANLKVGLTALAKITSTAAAKSSNGIFAGRIIFDNVDSDKFDAIECCFLTDSRNSNDPIIQHCKGLKKSDKADVKKEDIKQFFNKQERETIISINKDQQDNGRSKNHNCNKYDSNNIQQDTPTVNCNFNCNCNCNCNTCSNNGNHKSFKATIGDQQETSLPADSYSYSASKPVPVNTNKNKINNNTPQIVNCNFNCNCNCNCNNCQRKETGTVPITATDVVTSQNSTSTESSITVSTNSGFGATPAFIMKHTSPLLLRVPITEKHTERLNNTMKPTTITRIHRHYNTTNISTAFAIMKKPQITNIRKSTTPNVTTKQSYTESVSPTIKPASSKTLPNYFHPNTLWYTTSTPKPLSSKVFYSSGKKSTNVTTHIYPHFKSSNSKPSLFARSLNFTSSESFAFKSTTTTQLTYPLTPIPSSTSTHSTYLANQTLSPIDSTQTSHNYPFPISTLSSSPIHFTSKNVFAMSQTVTPFPSSILKLSTSILYPNSSISYSISSDYLPTTPISIYVNSSINYNKPNVSSAKSTKDNTEIIENTVIT